MSLPTTTILWFCELNMHTYLQQYPRYYKNFSHLLLKSLESAWNLLKQSGQISGCFFLFLLFEYFFGILFPSFLEILEVSYSILLCVNMLFYSTDLHYMQMSWKSSQNVNLETEHKWEIVFSLSSLNLQCWKIKMPLLFKTKAISENSCLKDSSPFFNDVWQFLFQ